ncbi:MAG: DNA/RNA non-specific endonuclease [Bacteroidales bacterium]|nr:DNA/RNA non-specific endonuclease [Bacteroidales bacterium]
MKRSLRAFSVIAALASVLASCNKTEMGLLPVPGNDEPEGEYVYVFAIGGGAETRAVLADDEIGLFGQWEEGDKLGSITTKSNGFSPITPASGDEPATFRIYSYQGLAAGNTITVWYPYTSTQTNPKAVSMGIPTVQGHLEDGSFDFDAMPMVAKQITVTAEMATTTTQSPLATINFANLGSLVDFKVYSTNPAYAGEKVQGITFTADAPIAGNFTMDLTAVDPDQESTLAISGYEATSVTSAPFADLPIGTTANDALDLYMVVAPGSYAGMIVVETDAATYTYTLSSNREFVRSGLKTFGLNLGSAGAVRSSKVATDVLNRELTGVSGTQYADWSGKTSNSQAVYAGNSAGGNSSIQLRATSPSGIVTTTSGGKVRKVTITWNAGTTSERTLQVYGKNSAYSLPADLYDTSTQGTLLGTIATNSQSMTLEISEDYAFIGLRSAANSLYLDEIRIEWETTGSTPATGHSVTWTDPTEAGCSVSATVDGNGIVSGSTFATGTVVTISATAGSGYTFAGWTVNGATAEDATSANTTFTIGDSDVSFSAAFSGAVVTTKYYELVTDLSELSVDDKVLIVNESQQALPAFTSSGTVSATDLGAAYDSENDWFSATDAVSACAVTLKAPTSTVSNQVVFKLLMSNGYYIMKTSAGGTGFEPATASTAVGGDWTLSLAGSRVHVANNYAESTRCLVWRAGSTNKFGAYAASNINGTEYFDIYFYKLTDSNGARVTTRAADQVGSNSAKLNGSFKGATGRIHQAGFVWTTDSSLLANPDGNSNSLRWAYDDNCVGTIASATISCTISDLSNSTTYYYRAFVAEYNAATGNVEYRYGAIVSFTTSSGQSSGLPACLTDFGMPDLTALNPVMRDHADQRNDRDDYWYGFNTSSSTRQLAIHTFTHPDSSEETVNYVVLYDGSRYAPVWTAHTMNTTYWPDKGVERSSGWTDDPAITLTQISGLDDNSKYSRGHFVASNYRKSTDGQNAQTFYNTNKAPQWQNGFNNGVWSTLEGRVKDMSPSGTTTMLYVITGVLYEGDLTYKPSGNLSVPLPSHFYKCIMKCTLNGNTVSSAQGIAFVYTNESHTGHDYYESAFVTSIDQIEQRAGFDFFAAVPDDLESVAESNMDHGWFTGQ